MILNAMCLLKLGKNEEALIAFKKQLKLTIKMQPIIAIEQYAIYVWGNTSQLKKTLNILHN